jgi:hypothetical protein
MAQDRIAIHGPQEDGNYLVEFRSSDGSVLALSVPAHRAEVLRRIQADIPYGIVVPTNRSGAMDTAPASTPSTAGRSITKSGH